MKIGNNDRLKELNKLLEEWHLAKEQRKMAEGITPVLKIINVNTDYLEVINEIIDKYKKNVRTYEYKLTEKNEEKFFVSFHTDKLYGELNIYLKGHVISIEVVEGEEDNDWLERKIIYKATLEDIEKDILFTSLENIFKMFIKEETTKTKQKQKEEFSLRFPEMGDRIYQIYSDGSIFKTTYDDSFKHVFKQGNAIDSEAQAELESKRRDLMTRFKQFRYLCNEKVTTATPESVLYYIYKDDTGVLRYSYDYQNMNEYRMFGSFLEEKDIKRAREIFGKEILELF